MSSCLVFGLPTVVGIAAAAAVGYYYFKNKATEEVKKRNKRKNSCLIRCPKLERLCAIIKGKMSLGKNELMNEL